jgi:hypothetical protein
LWIFKNGLKATGMASFGRTHEDAEIRGVSSFVKQLPGTTSREYLAMEKWFKENGKGNEALKEYELRS